MTISSRISTSWFPLRPSDLGLELHFSQRASHELSIELIPIGVIRCLPIASKRLADRLDPRQPLDRRHPKMAGDDGPHRITVVLREITAVHRVGDQHFPLQGFVSRQAPSIGDRAWRDRRLLRRSLIGTFKHNLTSCIFDISALEQSCQGHAGPFCVADGAKLPLCAFGLRDQEGPAIAGALQCRDPRLGRPDSSERTDF
jgi:hypothetical protein